jgi:DNA ligase (NAD+)
MDKISRIKSLTNELNQYRNQYYNFNNSIINDFTYDSLFDELHALELETDFVLSNSPTQTVGYEVKSKLNKRMHPTPLRSLDKTKSIDELNKWRKDKDIILMLKADGLTVELDYDNGQLIGGYTRGNGEIGEDISHNCRVFKNIPLTIPFKGKLRVSGEAIIHWNDFNNINTKLSNYEKYATPRNLVSGSVRQLDSKVCAKRNVHFYAFNILECSEELSDSKDDNFTWLMNLGFDLIGVMKLNNNVTDYEIKVMKSVANEEQLPIDGLVLSYDSIKYSNSLGTTSHHPLHSLAFKFYDETEETILRNVEWNTTRTGQITPTGIFDTVIIDNTEVSRASLHNLSFIRDLQLNIGCRIQVSKRNLIIPHVEENLDRDNGLLEFPSVCPSCGGKTEIRNTGTADFLFCTNDNCPAKLLDKFVNFVKRDGMNIEGLSEATVEKFINKGWLQKFDDIYYLNEHKSEIIKMEGFGHQSYNNLWSAIEKSKSVKLENFINALGIEGVGLSTAKLLAKRFKTMDNFIHANNTELLNIDGVGEITVDSVCDYLADNLDVIDELMNILNFIQNEKKESSLKDLTGQIFVITGSVNSFKNRDEFKELVESLNGKVTGSVTSKTNYLVNNDVNSTSGKNKTAKDLGVKIISEQQFNEMIGRA